MTITRARIDLADHGRTMTLEEFRDAEAEEGYRYELAKGVLEVADVPGEPHGLIVYFLYRALSQYFERHSGAIYRFGGASEYRLWLPGMVSARNPDIGVTRHNTPKDLHHVRPPSLVMEVVSSGTEAHERDYVTKRAEYLAYGLREYWIIDPIARRILVLLHNGDAWIERVFGDGQTAVGLVLRDLAIPVSDVWTAMETATDESEE